MKCDYCKYKDMCNKKWYECDRQLVISNNQLICESAGLCKEIDLKSRLREYRSTEKVVFLGFEFNRTSSRFN